MPSPDFEDILSWNIHLKKEKVSKGCEHSELGEVRVIFRKCRCCGKMVVVPDDEYIQKRGVEGRGWYKE